MNIRRTLGVSVLGIATALSLGGNAQAATCVAGKTCVETSVNGLGDVLKDLVGSGSTGGDCNGTVDTNCSYCSLEGSNFASPKEYCDRNVEGFYSTGCTLWVAAECIVG